jgi:hypothetical protein
MLAEEPVASGPKRRRGARGVTVGRGAHRRIEFSDRAPPVREPQRIARNAHVLLSAR